MTNISKPYRRRKGEWSDERRAAQAEHARTNQPWLKSTGPKTSAGKARAAMNALKHSLRSATVSRLNYLLWRHNRLLDAYVRHHRFREDKARLYPYALQPFEIKHKFTSAALFS